MKMLWKWVVIPVWNQSVSVWVALCTDDTISWFSSVIWLSAYSSIRLIQQTEVMLNAEDVLVLVWITWPLTTYLTLLAVSSCVDMFCNCAKLFPLLCQWHNCVWTGQLMQEHLLGSSLTWQIQLLRCCTKLINPPSLGNTIYNTVLEVAQFLRTRHTGNDTGSCNIYRCHPGILHVKSPVVKVDPVRSVALKRWRKSLSALWPRYLKQQRKYCRVHF